MFQNTEIFESPCFRTQRLKNLHGLNTEFWISVFQFTEIQKSLCIETRRFCKAKLFIFSNLCVSIHGDSKISVYKTQKILILRVSIHGDSKISVYWNTKIENFRVLYMQIFFLRPTTQWNRHRWWKYFRVLIRRLGTTNLWKKQSSKISCNCPFKNSLRARLLTSEVSFKLFKSQKTLPKGDIVFLEIFLKVQLTVRKLKQRIIFYIFGHNILHSPFFDAK